MVEPQIVVLVVAGCIVVSLALWSWAWASMRRCASAQCLTADKSRSIVTRESDAQGKAGRARCEDEDAAVLQNE